jgi:hypothetical protein
MKIELCLQKAYTVYHAYPKISLKRPLLETGYDKVKACALYFLKKAC